MNNKKIDSSDIAIIGMGCYYPGASDLKTLWENIVSSKRQFRRFPDQRLPMDLYSDPEGKDLDKTYATQAACIEGFEFDWIKRRIPKKTIETTDIVHWLAFEAALQALDDAGYKKGELPKETTGVILGNTLTGEQTRSVYLRQRWPFVSKVIQRSLQDFELTDEATRQVLERTEEYYKSVFPVATEDSLAGGLSNTIAGRICNVLDINGGGFTVDGACSSSLIAVATAADKLINGSLDAVFAGGVDVSLDTFEMVGFSRTGALTADEMRVYDRRGNGFIPGEGCGFILMKRLADARRDGDKVYATLKGWGISSDGRGGITAPNGKYQGLALSRAYEMAGYAASDLDFIEGHGTGTSVGDREELKGIATTVGNIVKGDHRSCGLTSFKSIVGHTKAAAGAGGLIKAILAVNQRVIPPTSNCDIPNQYFDTAEAQNIYPVSFGQVFKKNKVMRAGVSAMGFGGINTHVTVESGDEPRASVQSELSLYALLATTQKTEIYPLAADDTETLLALATKLQSIANGMSISELPDLASHCGQHLTAGKIRATIIANHPSQLDAYFNTLIEHLRTQPLQAGDECELEQGQILLCHSISKNKVGLLFPGQGSQQLNMAYNLIRRFDWAKKMLDNAEEILRQSGWSSPKSFAEIVFPPTDRALNNQQLSEWKIELTKTNLAQPAICLASAIWNERLRRLGITPVAVGGHSLGELSAFHASGAFDYRTLLSLAILRGKTMHNTPSSGGMVALLCNVEIASKIISSIDNYITIANINLENQTVVSGEIKAIEQVLEIALAEGIQASRLPVSNAFHSDLIKNSADIIRTKAKLPKTLSSQVPVISAMTGTIVEQGTSLPNYFADQVLSQVDFISLVKTMSQSCDLLIEVGPGQVLSNMAERIVKDSLVLAFPLESKALNDIDLNTLLARYFTFGGDVKWDILYEGRLIREFTPASSKQFIENPCEREFSVSEASPQLPSIFLNTSAHNKALNNDGLLPKETPQDSLSQQVITTKQLPITVEQEVDTMTDNTSLPSTLSSDIIAENHPTAVLLFELLEESTGFPRESLSLDLRLLDDLNLDSIKAAELIGSAAQKLKIGGEIDPAQFANASIEEISEVLVELEKTSATLSGQNSSIGKKGLLLSASNTTNEVKKTVDNDDQTWVRDFVMTPVVTEISTKNIIDLEKGLNAVVLCDKEELDLAQALAAQFIQAGIKVSGMSFNVIKEKNHLLIEALPNYIVLILPRSTRSLSDQETVLSMIERIQSIASIKSDNHPVTICFTQFSGGDFGIQNIPNSIEQCGSVALASSLHLEQKEFLIRTLDFCPTVNSSEYAEKVFAEMSTNDKFMSAAYSRDMVRSIVRPVLHETKRDEARVIQWNTNDVIMVTGGAKGITAECALALAQSTNVKMALVGSSPIPNIEDESSEITLILKRFAEAGLQVRYYSCDMANYQSVVELKKRINTELGEITGVIHGAALNKPRPMSYVSTDQVFKEISPKVLGALNLSKIFDQKPLKLFSIFTSIIGVSGMTGNSWYGFSNEVSDIILAQYGAKHPETQIISTAFSVWGEVGMGARMDSTDFLEKLGISAIPTKEGVQHFLQLIFNQPKSRQVVVTARLAGLDTWIPPILELPYSLRYLEDITYEYPHIEVKSHCLLTLEKDPYVKDHVWKGSYLFPTVFGLEAMAQSVAYVTGIHEFKNLRIENIMLNRPIVVNESNGLNIQIHARVLDAQTKNCNTRVQVSISTEGSNYQVSHFSACFVLNGSHSLIPESLSGLPTFPDQTIDIDPKLDLYSWLLFQGPLYQRLKQIYRLDNDFCMFSVETKKNEEQHWMLGSPYVRDAFLQSVQPMVPKDISLPVRIDSIDILNPSASLPDNLKGIAVNEELVEKEYRTSVSAINPEGDVIERMEGYRIRILENREDYPVDKVLVAPKGHDEKSILLIASQCAQALEIELPKMKLDYIPNLSKMPKAHRHIVVKPILEQWKFKITGENMRINWLDDGKPIFVNEAGETKSVSLSHNGSYLLSVSDEGEHGCDIEDVSQRTEEEWNILFGKQCELALSELQAAGDSLNLAGTRLWATRETIFKATNEFISKVTIKAIHSAAAGMLLTVQTKQGEFNIVTFPVSLIRGGQQMVAITALSTPVQALEIQPAASTKAIDYASYINSPKASISVDPKFMPLNQLEAYGYQPTHYYMGLKDGADLTGCPVFVQRSPLYFKDSQNLSRGIYFSNFFLWMGKIRESGTYPVMSSLSEQLVTGEWGLVTNHSSLTILGDATTGDIIEVHFWVSKVFGPDNATVDLFFDWRKILQDGSHERIAKAEMRTSWVKILDHGLVAPEPLPDYMNEFTDTMGKTDDSRGYETLPEPFKSLISGDIIYQAPSGPRSGHLLVEETLQPTLEDSNLVGNVYFSNYARWQGRIRDKFFYHIAPEYFRGIGVKGELITTSCNVDHLREAMPFDYIVITMYIVAIAESGINIRFEYFRQDKDSSRVKLATGSQSIVWAIKDENQNFQAAPLPEVFKTALLFKAGISTPDISNNTNYDNGDFTFVS
ncbi:MAG: SDR family NAD(P)-dependent oxidoreductase [Methylococcales bacterium]|nr:SDR family NAD(P)-dependent oxidoreductase [Methylococcales bacterium]